MIDISSSASAVRPSYQDAATAQLRRTAEQAQSNANSLQMQARDAWQKVENATSTARAVDSQANQAVSNAGKAQQNLSAFRSAAMSSTQAAPVAPPPSTYTASASAVVSAPVAAPATINNIGQTIGKNFNVEA